MYIQSDILPDQTFTNRKFLNRIIYHIYRVFMHFKSDKNRIVYKIQVQNRGQIQSFSGMQTEVQDKRGTDKNG